MGMLHELRHEIMGGRYYRYSGFSIEILPENLAREPSQNVSIIMKFANVSFHK